MGSGIEHLLVGLVGGCGDLDHGCFQMRVKERYANPGERVASDAAAAIA